MMNPLVKNRKTKMLFDKKNLFLVVLCLAAGQGLVLAAPTPLHSNTKTVPSSATVASSKKAPFLTRQSIPRAVTTVFGLPEHHLAPKAFLKNSLPNLVALSVDPLARKVINIWRHSRLKSIKSASPASVPLIINSIKTELIMVFISFCTKLFAFEHTQIQKEACSRTFQETMIEITGNEVLRLLENILEKSLKKSDILEFGAGNIKQKLNNNLAALHSSILCSLHGFHVLRMLNSMYQRHAFLKRMPKSKGFVLSRTIPKHMIGKKYLTLQSSAGYALRHLGDIINRAQKITNAVQADITSSPIELPSQLNTLKSLINLAQAPVIAHISPATVFSDLPYLKHVFILEEDVNLLSRRDKKILHGFMKEDYYHAMQRIHNYMGVALDPLWTKHVVEPVKANAEKVAKKVFPDDMVDEIAQDFQRQPISFMQSIGVQQLKLEGSSRAPHARLKL